MSAMTTVPVSIEPEAEARVAELGMRREFEQMLDHIRQAVPELKRVRVSLAYPPDYDDDPRVIIDVHVPADDAESESWYDAYRNWLITTVSPDVWRHILLMPIYEAENEG